MSAQVRPSASLIRRPVSASSSNRSRLVACVGEQLRELLAFDDRDLFRRPAGLLAGFELGVLRRGGRRERRRPAEQ
jgi:hypothetical protein